LSKQSALQFALVNSGTEVGQHAFVGKKCLALVNKKVVLIKPALAGCLPVERVPE